MSEDLMNVMGSFIENELNAYEETYKELEKKGKEIERLNNIINELEKWLEEQENNSTYPSMIFIGSVKARLQELKGNDK